VSPSITHGCALWFQQAQAHRVPKHGTDSVTSSVRLSPPDPRLGNLDRPRVGQLFDIATCRVSRAEMVEKQTSRCQEHFRIVAQWFGHGTKYFPHAHSAPLGPDRPTSPCRRRPRGLEDLAGCLASCSSFCQWCPGALKSICLRGGPLSTGSLQGRRPARSNEVTGANKISVRSQVSVSQTLQLRSTRRQDNSCTCVVASLPRFVSETWCVSSCGRRNLRSTKLVLDVDGFGSWDQALLRSAWGDGVRQGPPALPAPPDQNRSMEQGATSPAAFFFTRGRGNCDAEV
jgi:hypothetical protein